MMQYRECAVVGDEVVRLNGNGGTLGCSSGRGSGVSPHQDGLPSCALECDVRLLLWDQDLLPVTLTNKHPPSHSGDLHLNLHCCSNEPHGAQLTESYNIQRWLPINCATIHMPYTFLGILQYSHAPTILPELFYSTNTDHAY